MKGWAQGSLIRQAVSLSATDAILFENTGGTTIEVTRIFLTNTTGSAILHRLGHSQTAPHTALTQAIALYWDVSIASNSTIQLGSLEDSFGIHVRPGEALMFRTDSAGLTYHVYGVSATATMPTRGI